MGKSKKQKKPSFAPKYESTHHEAIIGWLCRVKFKRRLFGGIDEADVWRKIEELNALYEAALWAGLAAKTINGDPDLGEQADDEQ